ncbi:major facilitator superfamily domain-containing protein [Microdochium trichocladiopsis]|uniref:Major facilitator superfamily domain-containing protein n=1 Tax=Microdochium trichocladiopsis TaxID=1682393 RepID=A0A9P8Y4Y0_9PEZI|nr:major facilitator superfamily domain-containing protein [Microdochium trichocladiopsis]KAH7028017.1 major facilitator superfamily domain-containing protein [Microdochium trichocladiopsis]
MPFLTRSHPLRNDYANSNSHTGSDSGSGSALPNANEKPKTELKPEDVASELPFAYSRRKKWLILCVVFLVQVSMNLNTTLYSNGIPGIAKEFGVTEEAARWGAAAFLIAYAFGCELWAPWSEEFGRKIILQCSMFMVNVFGILATVAPNFGAILAARTLGGICTAGGSVTLAIITDMFDSHDDDFQYATAFIVFSSVGGSIFGPIVGGFIEEYADWRYTGVVQVAFGFAIALLHLFTPETRTTSVLDKIAKKKRASDPACNIYGPGELKKKKTDWAEVGRIWIRPFIMFVTEPIVLSLSLLSGFSDALIFMQVQAFGLIYQQWGFGPINIGLAFIPLFLGYVAAWVLFIPFYRRNMAARKADPSNEHAQYEARLKPLLYLAPCLPVGLIIFGWTSGGPPVHWAGTMVGSFIIGIANYAVYASTIEYMVRAYGAEYSASATGGNGWARDFLAGVLTVPAVPFYTNIAADKGLNFQIASTILFGISLLLVGAVFWVYFKGASLRRRSKFAQELADEGN